MSLSVIDTYRQHVAARQLYIDKCAVVRSELDNMDQQAIQSIVDAYLSDLKDRDTQFLKAAVESHKDYYESIADSVSLTHIDGSDSDTNSDSYGDIVQPSPSPTT